MAVILRKWKGVKLTHEEMDNNLLELYTHPNGMYFTNDKGKGIRLNFSSPSFGWHNLKGNIIWNTDNAPTLSTFLTTP